MAKKLIAIGLRPNQEKNVFSGQSMMFEAFIEHLQANHFEVSVIDLASKYDDINVGKIASKRIFEYLGIIAKAVGVFAKNKGSVVYLTTAQTKGGFYRDFIFIRLASLFGCKLLLQQFGSNFENFFNSISPKLQQTVLDTFGKGSKIVVEGSVTKEQFKVLKDYETKVQIVSNGLPERNLKSTDKGKTYDKANPFHMIYLSYMIESKGFWDVLHAVDILKNKYNLNVKCVFSGTFKSSVDDTLYPDAVQAKKAFEEFIKSHDLETTITYYEGLMGDKKAEEFIKSNVFLLPSFFKFEGQPVSVLEAMAYGSLPIVTKYRMIPEMVTDETGVFVDPKSPEQIANAVKTLMESPERYAQLSQQCVDRYQEKFTLDSYCKNLMNIVNQI